MAETSKKWSAAGIVRAGRYAVIVDVCSDSSVPVTPPRRDAATRTIRRQAFTSLTASGVSPARAWTRTAHVPSDSRINTTRGKESRRTLFVWQSQCRAGSPQNRGIPTTRPLDACAYLRNPSTILALGGVGSRDLVPGDPVQAMLGESATPQDTDPKN